MERKVCSQTKLLSLEVRLLRSTLEKEETATTPRILRY
jgi:hypothetical protein